MQIYYGTSDKMGGKMSGKLNETFLKTNMSNYKWTYFCLCTMFQHAVCPFCITYYLFIYYTSFYHQISCKSLTFQENKMIFVIFAIVFNDGRKWRWTLTVAAPPTVILEMHPLPFYLKYNRAIIWDWCKIITLSFFTYKFQPLCHSPI